MFVLNAEKDKAVVNKITLRETAPRDLVAILEIKFILTCWFIHLLIDRIIVVYPPAFFEPYDASAGRYLPLG